jgi:ABC-type branched-subunit amino acid transport system ATPase component/ABC-type branched-subunit amino acid transport system permease subunit
VFGYAGQHAFGHPVFFGVGAYASALLATRAGWPVIAALAGGAAITGLIGLAVAYPCFRLRGIYFGVATFAFARVIYLVAQNWIGLTRGPMGIPSVPALELLPAALFPGAAREVRLHVSLVLLLAVTLVVLHRVLGSVIGRSWIAIRENEELAASLGIPALRYKMAAFGGGAVLAALGGGLYAHYVSFVSPTELSFHYIGIVFIMVIAGGTGTLAGPVVGGLVFGILPEVLRVAEHARNLLLGSVLLVTIAFLPEGLVGLWTRWSSWRRGRGGVAPAPAAPSARSADGRQRADAAPALRPARALEIRSVTHRFGGLGVLSDVSFRVAPGTILGLIGPNGAGKTTLFNVISGVLRPTTGDVTFGGLSITGRSPAAIARLGIVRTFQITSLFPDLTVEDNVRTATHLWAHQGLGPALARSPAFRAQEAAIERTVDETLALVRLTASRTVPARALSYGAQRGLEVALALATRCEVLLLDEPAAGLNPEETAHLRELILGLRRRGLTVVLIEHDMQLVMGLCDRIVVLHHGQKIGEGTAQEVVADPRVIEAYLGGEPVRA